MSEPIKAKLMGRVRSEAEISQSGFFRWKDQEYQVEVPPTWGMPWRDDSEDILVHVSLPDGTELIGSIHFER